MPRSSCYECSQLCLLFLESDPQAGTRDILPYSGPCLHKSRCFSNLSVTISGLSPVPTTEFLVQITLMRSQCPTPLTLTLDLSQETRDQVPLSCPVCLCKGEQISLRVESPDTTTEFRVNAQLC